MTYDLLIDLEYPERSNNIIVKRNDNNSRIFKFRVTEGGKPFDMSKVTIASLRATRPDHTFVFADVDIDGDVLTYRMSENLCNVTGKVTCEVSLYTENQEEISSFEFYILVENLLFDENDFLSQNDLSGFKSYLSRAQLAAASAEGVMNAFVIGSASVDQILAQFKDEYELYQEYLEGLEKKVQSGYFNGERGPQGENGKDAVLLEGYGIVGFEIKNGHLLLHYVGEEAPDFELDERGHLIYKF